MARKNNKTPAKSASVDALSMNELALALAPAAVATQPARAIARRTVRLRDERDEAAEAQADAQSSVRDEAEPSAADLTADAVALAEGEAGSGAGAMLPVVAASEGGGVATGGGSTGAGLSTATCWVLGGLGIAGVVALAGGSKGDKTPPPPPVITAVATDDIVNAAERAAGVTVSGTAEADAVISVTWGNTTKTVTASGGSWSVSFAAAEVPADGSTTISVVAKDAAGNASAAGSKAVTIDSTAPTAPVVAAVAGDNTVNAAEKSAGVTVSGTAEAGSSVAITWGSVTKTVTATGGSFTATFAATDVPADGSSTISAVATDAVGNKSVAGTRSVSVDTSAPALPVVSIVALDNLISAAEKAYGVTVSGTAETGSSVAVTWGAVTKTVTATGGSFSASFAAADIPADGSTTISAVATDAAGNKSSTGTRAVSIDSTAPAAPVIAAVAVDNAVNAAEKAAGVAISGTAEAGASVAVTWGAVTKTVTATGGTFNAAFAAAELPADGSTTVSVVATDALGNASLVATRAVVVDTVAPDAPAVALQQDTGASATDGVTRSATVLVTGLATGASWQYSVDAGTTWNTGSGSSFVLAAGSYGADSIRARQTDGAGNVSAAGSLATAVTLDATGPQLSAIALDSASDSGIQGDGISTAVTPTVVITAEAGATLRVDAGAGAGFIDAGVATGSAQSLTLPTPYAADGSYTVTVEATDLAGNVTTRSTTYVLDRTVPASPTLALAQDTGSSASDSVTRDGLVNVLNLEPTGTWQYSIDGGATWLDGVGSSFTLVEGSYAAGVLRVRQTDAAGGTSAVFASTQDVVVDSTAPDAPSLNNVAIDDVVSGAEKSAGVTVSGTAEAGMVVAVTWGAVTKTVTATGGVFSVDFAAGEVPADGSQPVSAVATDLAGNTSVSGTRGVTVDSSGPAEPMVALAVDTGASPTDNITSNGLVNLLNLEAGASWQYSIDSGATWIDGVGSSFTLAPGSYPAGSLRVRQTDGVGNTSAVMISVADGLIDATAPVAPTISVVAGDDVINSAEQAAGITVSGTAEAGSSLAVSWGSVTKVVTATGGVWSANFMAAEVPVGASTAISAVATDLAGNASAAGTRTVSADLAAPAAPGIVFASDTGASASDAITQNGVINVSGLEAGATWQYSTNAGATWTAGVGASFTLAPASYAMGSIQVRQTDAAGNTGAAVVNPIAALVDVTAPQLPTASASGNTLTLRYAEALDAVHPPAASQFTVALGGGGTLSVTAVTVTGSNVVLTLSGSIASGSAFTLTYTDATAGDDVAGIQDLAGNDAISFSSGVVADGYVRGATVYIDVDGNGQVDPLVDFSLGVTDASGNFFIPAGAPTGAIIATGGVNVDTGAPNTVALKAPAGSTTINPLTTLVQAVVEASGGTTDAATAAATVATNLGLTLPAGTSLTSYDPISAGNVDAQKAAAQVATVVALASAGDAATASTVLGNLATEIQTAANTGTTLNLADAGTLSNVLAGTSASAEVQSTIADAASTIGTATSLAAITTAQAQFLDKIAPNAPTLSAPALGNTATPTVRINFDVTDTSGRAAVAGDTLVLTEGGVQLASVVLSAADVAIGYRDLASPVLADGVHALAAAVVDQAGNRSDPSAAVAMTVDTAAPTAPSIDAIASDDRVNAGEQAAVIGGHAEANATVQLSLGGQTRTVTANAEGDWNYALTAADLTAMGEGEKQLSATATDAAGNTSAAASRTILIDTVAPLATASTTGVEDNVAPLTGNVTDGGVTNDNTLALSGPLSTTLAAGDVLAVYDGVTRLGLATVSGLSWQFTTGSLANGAHSFSVRVEDAAGNAGTASAPYVVTVDASVPTAVATIISVTDDVALFTGALAAGARSNDATPVINGTLSSALQSGDQVVVYDGSLRLGAATVSGQSWQYTPAALGDGTHRFTAVVENAGGNQGAVSAPFSLFIDTAAPDAPSINALAGDDVVNAAEQSAVLSGRAEAGASVALTLGSVVRTVTAAANGTWTYALTGDDLAALGQGSKTLSAVATDSAGNSSAAGTRAVTIDTQGPSAPVFNTVAGDNLVSAAELAAGVTLSGTAEAGSRLALTLGAGNVRGLTVGDTGAWTYTLTAADIAAMGQGPETLRAIATDAAGNLGAPVTREMVIDTQAPSLTAFAVVANGEAGKAASNIATPTIQFTAEAGALLEVNLGDGRGFVAAGVGTGSVQTLTQPVPFVADGRYTVTLRATDAAGNVTTRTGAYTYDTTAPGVPAIASVAGNDIVSLAEKSAGVVVSGTAEAGATVTVTWGATTRTVVANGGNWSTTFAAGDVPADGARTLTAVARDIAGNTGGTSSRAVTVDSVRPAAPGVALAQDSGASSSDGVTGNATVQVSDIEAGASWQYSTDGGTSWTTGSGSSFALAQGSYGANAIRVRQVDAAGNVSDAASRAAATLVDTAGPQLLSATANGTQLTLRFNEALDPAGVPPTGAFTVTLADGSIRGAYVASVSGTDVVLGLLNRIPDGMSYTVSYAGRVGDASAPAVRDIAGNAVAATTLAGTVGSSNAPTASPLLVLARFTETANATVTLAFDDAVTVNNIGGVTLFKGNGTQVPITGYSLSGSTLTLNTSTTLTAGDTLRLQLGNAALQGSTGIKMYYGPVLLGGSGADVMDGGTYSNNNLTIRGNNGNDIVLGGGSVDYLYPGNGADIVEAGREGDAIYLNEGTPATDIVKLVEDIDSLAVYERYKKLDLTTLFANTRFDQVFGFDVQRSGGVNNDALDLPSGTIAADLARTTGNLAGLAATNPIVSHSISGGMVTFYRADGSEYVATGGYNGFRNAFQYLGVNLTQAGATVGFKLDANGDGQADSTAIYQDGAGLTSDLGLWLYGVTGVTLGNTAGQNVVQIRDTTGPAPVNAARQAGSGDAVISYSEAITLTGATDAVVLRNGVGDSVLSSLEVSGNQLTLRTSGTNATGDWLLLATPSGVRDAAGNAADGRAVAALGDSAANTINLSSVEEEVVVFGFDGNDSITGSAQADQIFAGKGADTVNGGAGADFYHFQQGDSPTVAFADLGATGLNTGDTFTFAGNAGDVISGGFAVEGIEGDRVQFDTLTPAPSLGAMGNVLPIAIQGINGVAWRNDNGVDVPWNRDGAAPSDGKVIDQGYFLVRGTYAGGVFTVNTTNGTDTLVVYDGTAGAGASDTALVIKGRIPSQLGVANDLIYLKDATPPAAPTLNAIAGNNGVNADERTAGVVVAGTAEANSVVTVSWGSGSKTAIVSATGAWSTTFAAGEVPADGSATLTAVARDQAGNASAATSRAITIDTVAPAVPVLALGEDTGYSGADGITSNGQVVVSGVEGGASWQFSIDGGVNWVNGTGNAFTLAPGSYATGAVKVRQTDGAGNVSAVGSLAAAVSVNTTAPVLESAVATDYTIILHYDQALDPVKLPSASYFTVTAANGAVYPIAYVETVGQDLILHTTGMDLPGNVTLTVSYRDPTTGNDVYAVQGLAGNDVAGFTQQVTSTNQAANAGVIAARFTESGGESTLTLVLDGPAVVTDTIGFSVTKLGGGTVGITASSVSGNVIVLQTNAVLTSTDVLLINNTSTGIKGGTAGSSDFIKGVYAVGGSAAPSLDVNSLGAGYGGIKIFGNAGSSLLAGSGAYDYLFAGNGSDTVDGGGAGDEIDLTETVASSDTVRVLEAWRSAPQRTVLLTQDAAQAGSPFVQTQVFFNWDTVYGFDVSAANGSTNDKLQLPSGVIAANVGKTNGLQTGPIVAHSIESGIVTFYVANGSTYAVRSSSNIQTALNYLSTNLDQSGATVGFYRIAEAGSSVALVVFQDGPAPGNDLALQLLGVSGVSLGTTAGQNVVQIVDTTAPQQVSGGFTAGGNIVKVSFSEPVVVSGSDPLRIQINGGADAVVTSFSVDGNTVTATIDQTLQATDYVTVYNKADAAGVTQIRDVADNQANAWWSRTIGGSGDNVIDRSAFNWSPPTNAGAGNDTLIGSSGREELAGGLGADRIDSGDGADWIVVRQGDSPTATLVENGITGLNTGDKFTFAGGATDVVVNLNRYGTDADRIEFRETTPGTPVLAMGNSLSGGALQNVTIAGIESPYNRDGAAPSLGLAVNQGYFLVRGDYVGGEFTVNTTSGVDTLVVYDGTVGNGVSQSALVIQGRIPGQLELNWNSIQLKAAPAAPAAPVIHPVTGNNEITAQEAGSYISITGTAPDGTQVLVNWGSSGTKTVPVIGGAWTATYTVGEIPADGIQAVYAMTRDVWGSTSTSAVQPVVINTGSNPTLQFFLDQDSGVPGDGISSNGHFLVAKSSQALEFEFSSDGGQTWFPQSMPTTGNPNIGSFELQEGSYAAGAVKLRVYFGLDVPPGPVFTNSQPIVIDRTNPELPVVNAVAGDDKVNFAESEAVVISGSAEAGTRVLVSWGSVEKEAQVGANGNWSVTYGTPLPGNDTVQVYAKVIDNAGNESPIAQRDVLIDVIAPGTPNIDTVTGDDRVTSSERSAGVAVTGTAEVGASVSVTWGSVTKTVTATTGTWSAAFDTSQVPTQATSEVVAVARDAAGNASNTAHRFVAVDPPVLSSASANGGVVTLNFSQPLNNYSLPAGSYYTITLSDGTTRAVDTFVQNGSTVLLYLFGNARIPAGEKVTISYSDPTAGDDAYALQNAAGNDIASFSTTVTAAAGANTPPQPVAASFTQGAAPIVGTWTTPSSGPSVSLTLLADGRFILMDSGEGGLEAGTYSYNSQTGALVFNVTVDNNGNGGIKPADDGLAFTALIVDGKLQVTGPGEVNATVLEPVAAGSGIAGTWMVPLGANHKLLALVLLPDGTAFLGEGAGTTDDGMERGTYVYDAGAGTLTLAMTFDSNANGGGVGMGTKVLTDVSLNANTLVFTATDEIEGPQTLTVNRAFASVPASAIRIAFNDNITVTSLSGLSIEKSDGTPIAVTGFQSQGGILTVFTDTALAASDSVHVLYSGAGIKGTTGLTGKIGELVIDGTGNGALNAGLYPSGGVVLFGNGGNDTLLGSAGFDQLRGGGGSDVFDGGGDGDLITLREPSPATDTIKLVGTDVSRALAQAVGTSFFTRFDEVQGFDVSGVAGANNDRIVLPSANIAVDTDRKDGTAVGGIYSHSISNGVVRFFNQAGNPMAVGYTLTLLQDAFGYLALNLNQPGATVAFEVDANGSGSVANSFMPESMMVYQDGIGPNADTAVLLRGVFGITLGTAAGQNVVQIVDGAAPQVVGGSLGTTIALTLSEQVGVSGNGFTAQVNGTGADIVTTAVVQGAALTLSTSAVPTAEDWLLLTSLTGVTDSASTALAAGQLYALGGTGNNTIDVSALGSGVVIYGNAGNDLVTGTGLGDVLVGGAGADTLAGGAGADRFVFAQGDSPVVTFADLGTVGQLGDGDTFTFAGNAADVISSGFALTGLQGDMLDLTTTVGALLTSQAAPSSGQVGDQGFFLVRGTYSSGVFTVNTASGADTLVVYDGTAGSGVSQTGLVLQGHTPAEFTVDYNHLYLTLHP